MPKQSANRAGRMYKSPPVKGAQAAKQSKRKSQRAANMSTINANTYQAMGASGPRVKLVDEHGKPYGTGKTALAMGQAKVFVDASLAQKAADTKLGREQARAQDEAIKQGRLKEFEEKARRRKLSEVQNVTDLATTVLGGYQDTVDRANRNVDNLLFKVGNIPTPPGNIYAPLIMLLLLYIFIVPVGGQPRIAWLWDVIIGAASLPPAATIAPTTGGGPVIPQIVTGQANVSQFPTSSVGPHTPSDNQPTKFWTYSTGTVEY